MVNRFASRRKSVFAETYDPENDADDDDGARAIFPKTDDQRSRLCDSVKHILLFRSLDKEQVTLELIFCFCRTSAIAFAGWVACSDNIYKTMTNKIKGGK